MKVSTGPIALARPGWGLEEGSITALVSNDAGGRPEVLAAQIICGAAVSGVRVLVLLPWSREEDSTWDCVVKLLSGGDREAAARSISTLPLVVFAGGAGQATASKAELVYAPGLSARDLRRLASTTRAPILTVGELDDETARRYAHKVIHVGGDALVVDGEGFEVPVVFDPTGPVYRQA